MITDVIDDAEVKNGVREDGTIYSVYSFARKLGQALSAGMTGALLSLIGYTNVTAFEPEITERIFKLSCIAPLVGFGLVALFFKKTKSHICKCKKCDIHKRILRMHDETNQIDCRCRRPVRA